MKFIACCNLFRYYRKGIAKSLLIMKMISIFILAFCLSAGAKSYSQKISLTLKNALIEKVFKQISTQTGFTFFYTESLLKKAKRVTIVVSNVTLEEALAECFKSQILTFSIVNQLIVIKEKEIAETIESISPVLLLIDIKGKITDEEGNPLLDVSIVAKSTGKGTTTDTEGKFSIPIREIGEILVISYVGYEKIEKKITSQAALNISLKRKKNVGDEIVVVGYGTQKKIDLTGSVGTVKSEFFKDRPITNASQALSGAVSGVFVNQNSGVPGNDNTTIRIRGIGTLNNSNPLILVDGIESSIDNIDPSDIASISVLKDAASASIYGSRASNGVVLVTTKRGSLNRTPSISYSGYYGSTSATHVPSVITNSAQFMELTNEAFTNSGNSARYTQAQIDRYKQNGPNTNWVKEIIKNGPIQQHNISVTGGNNNTSYLLSVGNLNQDGITPAIGYKRYNIRLNLDTKILDKLTIGTSLYLTRGNYHSPIPDVTGLDGPIAGSLIANPLIPAYDLQGRLANSNQTFLGSANPFTQTQYNSYTRTNQQFLGNLFAEYEIIKGLKVKGIVSLNYFDNDGTTFNVKGDTYDWISGNVMYPSTNALGLRARSYNKSNDITSWIQATYKKSIGNHNISLLAGYNQESFIYNGINAGRTNFPLFTVPVLNVGAATTATNNESATEWALQSVFGRVNYDYNERYLFEFNIRRDGSSRFGASNRYGTFPSVSAGWVISKENFMRNLPRVDLLKIRVSKGQLGNQYAQGTNYPFAGQVSVSTNYVINGNLVPGAAQTTFDNPSIRWETTTSSNIGLDVGLFKKLTIEADYFVRTTKDILYALPLPATAGGLADPVINTAKVQNKGWELAATYKEKIGDLRINVGFNVTHVNSKLLYIDATRTNVGDKVINGNYILSRGASLNSIYGYQAIGIFQSADEILKSPKQFGNYAAGDIKYADLDHNDTIDTRDRAIIGQEDPQWLYGANINLGYKGFDLSAIFQGVGNFQSYGGLEYYAPFFNGANLGSQWLNRWTPENKNGGYPKLYHSAGPSDAVSSFWIQNRAFVRLKNIQFGYTFPEKLLKKAKITNLRLYVNAQNLLTRTKFQGFDPERPDGSARGGSGYPTLKIITAGINLKF